MNFELWGWCKKDLKALETITMGWRHFVCERTWDWSVKDRITLFYFLPQSMCWIINHEFYNRRGRPNLNKFRSYVFPTSCIQFWWVWKVRSFRFNLSFLFVYVLCFFSPLPLFFPPSPPLSLHLPPLTISALHCGMLYSMEFNTRCGPLKTSQPPKL